MTYREYSQDDVHENWIRSECINQVIKLLPLTRQSLTTEQIIEQAKKLEQYVLNTVSAELYVIDNNSK